MSTPDRSPIEEGVENAALLETPSLTRKAPGKIIQAALDKKRGECKDLTTALDVKDIQIGLFEADIARNDKKVNALMKKIRWVFWY